MPCFKHSVLAAAVSLSLLGPALADAPPVPPPGLTPEMQRAASFIRQSLASEVDFVDGRSMPKLRLFDLPSGELSGAIDPAGTLSYSDAGVRIDTVDGPASLDISKANTAMSFAGTVRYSVSGGQVTVTFDRIDNNTTSTTSGSLKIRLLATTSPISGPATFSGYTLFESQVFGPIGPGRSVTGNVFGPYRGDPPAGTYNMVVGLFEYSASGCSSATADNYCTVASVTINSQTFGATPPPPAPTPPPPAPTPPPPSPASVVTIISTTGQQCYQNYPLAAAQQVQAAAPGVWSIYPSTTSCASLGMSILVGYLTGTALTVPVYTNSVTAAQALCASGFVEGCVAPPPVPAPPAPAPAPAPAPSANG